MALFDYTDIERQLNITLTSPEGQDTVNHLIQSVVSWAESRLGHSLERTTITDTFDEGGALFWLSNPVDVAELTAEVYNSTAGTYESYPYAVRFTADGMVQLSSSVASGFQALKLTYEAGWTDQTFPEDLKQALIELVAAKFLAGSSKTSEPELKRVTAGAYTAEYAVASTSSTATVPQTVMEVVDRYRRPLVL